MIVAGVWRYGMEASVAVVCGSVGEIEAIEAACDHCVFRAKGLCALADGPCPTFRAIGPEDLATLVAGYAPARARADSASTRTPSRISSGEA